MEVDIFVADMQLEMFGIVIPTDICPIKTVTIYCLDSPTDIVA
jgi:hypothetical protein